MQGSKEPSREGVQVDGRMSVLGNGKRVTIEELK